MSDEHKRIDRMLAEGKISPEEAARLRGALEKSEDVAEAPVAEPVTKRRLSKLAVAGALGVPAAIVAALLVYAFGMLIAEGMRGDERAGLAATVTGVAVVLAGFVLSVAALVAIRNNRETLCGKGLAIFGLLAILIPIAALILFCLYLLRSTSPPVSYDFPATTNEVRDDEQVDAARQLLSLWQKFQAITNYDSDLASHGKVLALVAPTWARAIRDCPTHEETAELTKGTVLGNDYPADKARLLKSGILDRRNIRPASSKGVMVIVEGDDEMLVPVVRLRDRWYFARDKVVFRKHGPQME